MIHCGNLNYISISNVFYYPERRERVIAIGLYVCVCVCVCVCVRVLPCNLGECFVSLLVEPIAGKNMSPSDKQLWRFLKNISVAEKS